MRQLVIFALFFLFYLIEANENYLSKKGCRALFDKTDDCIRKILYIGNNDMVFITNENLLNEHCTEIKASYKCLANFGKCLRLFPKEMFQIVMRGIKRMIKNRCDSRKGRKEFLKHNQCFRRNEVGDFNRCVDKGVLNLNWIVDNAPTDQLIPALCCVFHESQDCLKRKADHYCKTRTGPDTGDYVAKMAQSVVQDLMDISCGDRKSLAVCLKKEPKWMQKFEELSTPFDQIPHQNGSLFTPLIKLALRIDNPL